MLSVRIEWCFECPNQVESGYLVHSYRYLRLLSQPVQSSDIGSSFLGFETLVNTRELKLSKSQVWLCASIERKLS